MSEEKSLPPWKRELYQQADALDEPPEFQSGVIAGYHDAGVALAKASLPGGKPVLAADSIRKWAAGFVAGYIVRLEIEERKRHGTTERPAAVDV